MTAPNSKHKPSVIVIPRKHVPLEEGYRYFNKNRSHLFSSASPVSVDSRRARKTLVHSLGYSGGDLPALFPQARPSLRS